MDRKYSEAELGILKDLQHGGIALDGDVLDGIRSASRALSVCQTGSMNENCIFELDNGGSGYMLDVAIQNRTNRVIWLQEFRLEMLWQEPHFTWLNESPRVSPWAYTYAFPSPGPVGFDREVVLNHRVGMAGRLNPGGAFEGLLLGIGAAALPDEYLDRQRVRLTLEIFDRRGFRYSKRLDVAVSRRIIRSKQLVRH